MPPAPHTMASAPWAHDTSPRAIRVLIVDDQSMIRAGFAALLDAHEGITVVGTADDGAVPDARALREADVADDGRAGRDPCRRIDQGASVPQCQDVRPVQAHRPSKDGRRLWKKDSIACLWSHVAWSAAK
jgi:hypothetical protein